jgi:hypothetical protein
MPCIMLSAKIVFGHTIKNIILISTIHTPECTENVSRRMTSSHMDNLHNTQYDNYNPGCKMPRVHTRTWHRNEAIN